MFCDWNSLCGKIAMYTHTCLPIRTALHSVYEHMGDAINTALYCLWFTKCSLSHQRTICHIYIYFLRFLTLTTLSSLLRKPEYCCLLPFHRGNQGPNDMLVVFTQPKLLTSSMHVLTCTYALAISLLPFSSTDQSSRCLFLHWYSRPGLGQTAELLDKGWPGCRPECQSTLFLPRATLILIHHPHLTGRERVYPTNGHTRAVPVWLPRETSLSNELPLWWSSNHSLTRGKMFTPYEVYMYSCTYTL